MGRGEAGQLAILFLLTKEIDLCRLPALQGLHVSMHSLDGRPFKILIYGGTKEGRVCKWHQLIDATCSLMQ